MKTTVVALTAILLFTGFAAVAAADHTPVHVCVNLTAGVEAGLSFIYGLANEDIPNILEDPEGFIAYVIQDPLRFIYGVLFDLDLACTTIPTVPPLPPLPV